MQKLNRLMSMIDPDVLDIDIKDSEINIHIHVEHNPYVETKTFSDNNKKQ